MTSAIVQRKAGGGAAPGGRGGGSEENKESEKMSAEEYKTKQGRWSLQARERRRVKSPPVGGMTKTGNWGRSGWRVVNFRVYAAAEGKLEVSQWAFRQLERRNV